MSTLLHDFRERFHESILRLLWRQWSAFGVAGQGRTEDDWVIDPEALILVTTTFGRLDPRLFDEVLDWLSKEGGTINLQRLKNLQVAHRLGHPGVLAAMSATVGSQPQHLKWRHYARELAGTGQGRSRKPNFRKAGPVYEIPKTPAILFPDVPVMNEPDARFLQFGWLRGPVHLRGLSSKPNPHLPTNFLLKLRALFGLQARAEIVACLLCSEAERPTDIADLTGYFPRTVQLALNELARSGHILTGREAREKYFRIWKPDWKFLVHDFADFPRWINWSPLFASLDVMREKLDTPGFDSAAPSLQAIELRKVLDIMMPALRHSGLSWQLQNLSELTGKEFVEKLIIEITHFLDRFSQ